MADTRSSTGRALQLLGCSLALAGAAAFIYRRSAWGRSRRAKRKSLINTPHPIHPPPTEQQEDTLARARGDQSVLASPTPITYTSESVIELVRSTVPIWSNSAAIGKLSPDAFRCHRLTGGSSNSLWLLSVIDPSSASLESATPSQLVVRFYGASSGAFIERSTETLVAGLLSASGVGAHIYHHLEAPHSGRIEKFIPGRTLQHYELIEEEFGAPIVKELARLHLIDVPDTKEYAQLPRSAQLFRNIWKWLALALHARRHLRESPADAELPVDRADIYSLRSQNALYDAFGLPSLDDHSVHGVRRLADLPLEIRSNKWVREVEWLQSLVENWNLESPNDEADNNNENQQRTFIRQTMAYSKLGLCHNDLNPGNIMYTDTKQQSDDNDGDEPVSPAVAAAASSSPSSPVPPFTLIDFEYAAFNHPSFDLANHFCEYALDYTVPEWPFFQSRHAEYFMTQTEMIDRIKAYMEEKRKGQVRTHI